MSAGGVIVLNGTSSVGKTTLAARLQTDFAATGDCWLVIALDDFLGKLPGDWHRIGDHVGPFADDGFVFDLAAGGVRVGPVGRRLLAAYRASVACTARAGIDVIVDEAIFDEHGAEAWRIALDGLDVLWVRVDADPAVVDARESARGDRLVGLAGLQRGTIHRGVRYDLAVDTSGPDPGAAAAAVRRAWVASTPA